MKSTCSLIYKPITGTIRKIIIFYHPAHAMLEGLRFYDAAGTLIYETAYKVPFTSSVYKYHEILMKDGERIVGFQSRKYSDNSSAYG